MDAFKFLSFSFLLLGLLCATNGGSGSFQEPSIPTDLKSGQQTLASSSSSSSSPVTPKTTGGVPPGKSAGNVAKGGSSACGGVRGFLHLCATSSDSEEPSKNIEKRDLLRINSRESSEEKDDSNSSENSDESKERFGQTFYAGSIDVRVKPLTRITKRQVDPRAIYEMDSNHSKESESSEETHEKF